MIVIKLFRLGGFFYKNGFHRTAKFISYLNRFLFAVWIPSQAKIGKNFKLGYGGLGVVIHHDTEIGDNCLVAQNVTIGAGSKTKKYQSLKMMFT